MAAAEALFLRNGLVRTSVDAIVAAARTSKRDFYKHFRDRQGIFLEIAQQSLMVPNTQMDAIRQTIEQDVHKLAFSSGDIQRFLHMSARFIYDMHLDAQSLGLFRAALAASMLHPEVSGAVYRARSRTLVASYLEDHREDHRLTFDDAHLAAIRFGHLATDGLRFMLGADPLSSEEREKLAWEVSGLFLDGHAAPRFRAGDELSRVDLSGDPTPSDAKPRRIIEAFADTRLSPAVWDRMLDTAWAEFGAHGYDDTSLGVVAQKAGVSRNALYRQYGSKENLFLASAGRVVDRVYGGFTVPQGQCGQVHEALIELALQLLQRFLIPENLDLHRQLLIHAGQRPGMTSRIYGYLTDTVLKALSPVFKRLGDLVIKQEVAARAPWRFFVLASFGTRFIFVPPEHREQRELATEAVYQFLYGCRR
ncbi:putative TetR family transcriptional regulator [Sphingobium herbicidovorans NBRC 16415]|uniref:TetR family transcriptional regulator n=1 Tax=Sphingobium herbicidovorans (strain ATCC 700291 / DSM 11019 / CCUG 56400 / KCTC 2939 / LMG 18315 / NBRC 16415 / MH) TaxID=1219045 RepID=A0A086PA83_SPHHM|nr:TetR/AcrR family transcriptional regulator [Sphingobium herbicidovorans]KFG90301.1 putative TetR family transcriptional regulator [Sphingobium herbicidovorans NBRC 16415]